ncbi:MAG: clostripain-related cysteine peptidase [Thermoanaerobaculia bacterium]
MAKPAEWTFLVYMAGDNNLSGAGDTDLAEMRQVGSSGHLNVVVQFDNAGDNGTRRIHVGHHGGHEKVVQLAETDSGSPEVLVDFVRWAHKAYPAKRYALVLWNHGGGWEPAEIERIARASRSPGFSVREAPLRAASKLRRAFFRHTLERILATSADERAILSDDGSGHSLDTVELGKALEEIVGLLGQPIDLLGMDACLMANLEVAFQAAPYAKVLVASEETEPADGWPYGTVLDLLAEDPLLPPAELGGRIVEHYLRSYAGNAEAGDVTQAAFDLSKIDQLVTPFDALAQALLVEMPGAANTLWSAHRHSASFWDGTLRDLGQLAGGLEAKGSAAVAGAARDLLAALEPGPGRAILAAGGQGKKVDSCRGVSIYLPSEAAISPYYGDLELAKRTQWPRLLEAYARA